jgi:murein DD-endopeptidase MepM/ murein hydrolase activator NlpD
VFRSIRLFICVLALISVLAAPATAAVTQRHLRAKREAIHDTRAALSVRAPSPLLAHSPAGLGERSIAGLLGPRRGRRILTRRLTLLDGELNGLVSRYREQQAMSRLEDRLGHAIRSGGRLQTCPIVGETTFSDDFGAPRPGGRTHEGIDLSGPTGRPLVAAVNGIVTHSTSVLGGLGIHLLAGNGDDLYYAHLSAYEASGRVAAGTIIGRVGETGDATGPHLHFEYHPGGGAAVDPYRLLRAVC